VEGHRILAGELPAVSLTQAVARGLSDVRYLPAPPGYPAVILMEELTGPGARGITRHARPGIISEC
jgi:hypothetical protein